MRGLSCAVTPRMYPGSVAAMRVVDYAEVALVGDEALSIDDVHGARPPRTKRAVVHGEERRPHRVLRGEHGLLVAELARVARLAHGCKRLEVGSGCPVEQHRPRLR